MPPAEAEYPQPGEYGDIVIKQENGYDESEYGGNTQTQYAQLISSFQEAPPQDDGMKEFEGNGENEYGSYVPPPPPKEEEVA